MKLKRKQIKRLCSILGLCASIGLALALILYALKQHINLFFTPSQLLDQPMPQIHSQATTIRVGGWVLPQSIVYSEKGETVSFQLSDGKKSIQVNYQGLLPDLFREGQGVVAQGLWIMGCLMATQILAKHDENYRPPELRTLPV